MYPRVNLQKKNELQTEEWNFILLENELKLDSYRKTEQKTKKHKPQLIADYNRLNRRDSSLKVNEVPMSDELKVEAKQALFDKIIVVIE